MRPLETQIQHRDQGPDEPLQHAWETNRINPRNHTHTQTQSNLDPRFFSGREQRVQDQESLSHAVKKSQISKSERKIKTRSFAGISCGRRTWSPCRTPRSPTPSTPTSRQCSCTGVRTLCRQQSSAGAASPPCGRRCLFALAILSDTSNQCCHRHPDVVRAAMRRWSIVAGM